LNDIGLAQADAVGRRLRPESFDAIFSSDLIRAFRTASPVVAAPETDIAREPRLRERNLGVLQGLTGYEAKDSQPIAWSVFKSRDPALPLESGESLGEFHWRAVHFIDEVVARHAGQRILLVTHGGVLDAAYRLATGMPISATRDFPILNASINVISHDGRRWGMQSWGDVSHLPQELAMDDG
jgi:probable phosphoglycerate mutase